MRRVLAALSLAAVLAIAGCGAPTPSPAASASTPSALAGAKKATTAQINALSSAVSYLEMSVGL